MKGNNYWTQLPQGLDFNFTHIARLRATIILDPNLPRVLISSVLHDRYTSLEGQNAWEE